MPHVAWTDHALSDLVRLFAFLTQSNPSAAHRAMQVIEDGVASLRSFPDSGRTTTRLGEREWIISFGKGAYIVTYRNEPEMLYVLSVRHGRELSRL